MACRRAKFSTATEKVVLNIIKVNKVTDNIFQDTVADQAKRDILSQLLSVATKKELMTLTTYSNGVVRCYAFWALLQKQPIDLLPILIKHVSDTERIQTQFGDLGGREKVGDFMINIATPEDVDVTSGKLDPAGLAILDSILIYTPNELYAKDKAIEMAQPTEALYPRIRELAVKEGNQSAIVTLAKYRKPQDVSLILHNRDNSSNKDEGYFYTYRAIAQFPHPDFMPLLRKNLLQTLGDSHYDNEWSALYGAIATYKSPEALELLEVPFTKVKYPEIRTYHIGFVFAAVERIDDPIYDDLKWELWADESRISPDVFSYLCSKNPKKALILMEECLLKSDDPFDAGGDDDFDNRNARKSLTEIMLDLVLQKDSSNGIKIIRSKLATADVHLYPIIARKAMEIKDKSFIGPFLKRLGSDDNPYVYLAAAKGLISFKSNELNRKILLVSSKNENLRKGWGGKELTQLLKENNIY